MLIFLIISGVVCDGIKKCEKRLKNVAEKFGSKEKSRTFALPFEKRGSQQRRNSTTSSLKRLITVQEASTEKIQFIEKR